MRRIKAARRLAEIRGRLYLPRRAFVGGMWFKLPPPAAILRWESNRIGFVWSCEDINGSDYYRVVA